MIIGLRDERVFRAVDIPFRESLTHQVVNIEIQNYNIQVIKAQALRKKTVP